MHRFKDRGDPRRDSGSRPGPAEPESDRDARFEREEGYGESLGEMLLKAGRRALANQVQTLSRLKEVRKDWQWRQLVYALGGDEERARYIRARSESARDKANEHLTRALALSLDRWAMMLDVQHGSLDFLLSRLKEKLAEGERVKKFVDRVAGVDPEDVGAATLKAALLFELVRDLIRNDDSRPPDQRLDEEDRRALLDYALGLRAEMPEFLAAMMTPRPGRRQEARRADAPSEYEETMQTLELKIKLNGNGEVVFEEVDPAQGGQHLAASTFVSAAEDGSSQVKRFLLPATDKSMQPPAKKPPPPQETKPAEGGAQPSPPPQETKPAEGGAQPPLSQPEPKPADTPKTPPEREKPLRLFFRNDGFDPVERVAFYVSSAMYVPETSTADEVQDRDHPRPMLANSPIWLKVLLKAHLHVNDVIDEAIAPPDSEERYCSGDECKRHHNEIDVPPLGEVNVDVTVLWDEALARHIWMMMRYEALALLSKYSKTEKDDIEDELRNDWKKPWDKLTFNKAQPTHTRHYLFRIAAPKLRQSPMIQLKVIFGGK